MTGDKAERWQVNDVKIMESGRISKQQHRKEVKQSSCFFICNGFLFRGFDHDEILIMLGRLFSGRNVRTSESISGIETLSLFCWFPKAPRDNRKEQTEIFVFRT